MFHEITPMELTFNEEVFYFDEDPMERVRIDGELLSLKHSIYYADRKPISRWFKSQTRYGSLEASYLLAGDASKFECVDRVRFAHNPGADPHAFLCRASHRAGRE
jgi:hypothetical protein